MKKLISLLLIAAISLSAFTACGETDAFSDVTTNVAEYTYSSDAEEEPEETEEAEEDSTGTAIYDNTAVVEAYKTGDTSALLQDDLLIYMAVTDAIAEFYTEGMSEYEIILAAHDYITTHVTYDLSELSLVGGASDESSTPYGALIFGEAICMGYTTTFQLMMDMLGVESIIVSGEALDEEHAWNMVCLDGSWYHVDCTWDDYVPDYEGRRAFHTYLMVTDATMEIEHIWDRDSAPTADSEDYIYFYNNGLYAETTEELAAILEKEAASGDLRAEVAIPLENDVEFPELESGTIYAYWRIDLGGYSVIIYYFDEL